MSIETIKYHVCDKCGRKDDKIAKGRAPDETQRRDGGEGHQHPLFMMVETGGDKPPNLGKNDRAGQHHPADKGER